MAGLERFFQDAPLLVVLAIQFVAMCLAREFGAWARRREGGVSHSNGDASDESHILTAVLGLLALLVAFSFGMALNRYEARRELVVTEANALDAAWQDVGVLDDHARLRSLILQYARARLAYGQLKGSTDAAERAQRAAQTLQPLIWEEALKQVAPYRETPLASFVLTPIEQAFDAAGSRKAEMDARMPLVVHLTLSVYFIASAAVLGYASARARARHRGASFALFALFTLALGVVLDLDRPRGGLIDLPQEPMIDSVAAMRTDGS